MDTSKLLPTPELQAEFERFKKLRTDEEKLAFQKERQSRLDAMTERGRKAYLEVTEKALQETVKEARRFVERAEDALLRDKLGEIPEVISLSYIAKKIFWEKSELALSKDKRVSGKREARTFHG